jgi:hypothetical protein
MIEQLQGMVGGTGSASGPESYKADRKGASSSTAGRTSAPKPPRNPNAEKLRQGSQPARPTMAEEQQTFGDF